MPATSMRKPVVVAGVACAVACAWYLGSGSGRTVAQQPAKDPWASYKFLGAGTCQRCHTTPTGGDKPDFVLLTEYAIWRTQDKHSLAYAVLEGPRGQRMGELLGGDKSFVLKPEAGCLGCHAMHFPGREGDQFSLKDGVSCDGCHGPSSEWLTPHFAQKDAWRKKTPEEKFQLGMRDVRNPAVRAELCISCHVGDPGEGRVVTHAMYAAGHPPLPGIEVAAFSKNLPQHWMDVRDVPFLKAAPAEIQKMYHFHVADVQNTRLAVIGSGVALRDQMNLIASRSDLGAKDAKTVWPELLLPHLSGEKDLQQVWPQLAMAHSDCFACHHELKRPSWRQERGFGIRLLDGTLLAATPGRPQLRPWVTALFEISLHHAGPGGDAQRLTAQLKDQLALYVAACNSQPFGTPSDIHKAALAVENWTGQVVSQQLSAAGYDRPAAWRLLNQVCTLTPPFADFDTARQIASAIQVIYVELTSRDAQKPANDSRIRELIARLENDLDLWAISGADPGRQEREKMIRAQVEKLAARKLTTEVQYRDALRDVPHDKMREALLSAAFLNAWQATRNKDFANGAQAFSKYEPAAFKKTLEELCKLLPQK
jgi:hypothetical protein